MYMLKSYNKFFVCKVGKFQACGWEDFYIHRSKHDLKNVMKFETMEEAQNFLDNNPKVEEDFDAWIIKICESEWK